MRSARALPYVNVHTADFPGGEIRGQLDRENTTTTDTDIAAGHDSGQTVGLNWIFRDSRVRPSRGRALVGTFGEVLALRRHEGCRRERRPRGLGGQLDRDSISAWLSPCPSPKLTPWP